MSSDQRFTILILLISTGFAAFAWGFNRFVSTQDKRWARVDQLILDDTADKAARPGFVSRMDRLEGAMVKLSEIVTELGLTMARHEGWHERTDPDH